MIVNLCSCTKNFEKYNTDPNALPANKINNDNVYLGGFFKQMEESVFPVGGTGTNAANSYQLVENLVGDIFGGYHGMANRWNAAGDNTTYNFNAVGWNSAPFNLYYTNIVRNYDTIARYAAKNPDILAVAKIIKVQAAHRTVDMFGPIPYFDTRTVLGRLGSPYDPVDKIYLSFFKDLDSAILVLKPFAENGAKPLRYFDAVYRGDYRQWIRFANSLKLRLAMRMAYVDANNARKFAEEAVQDSYGVITENIDNATMQGVEGMTYNNPLQTLSEAYKETRLSAVMESFLTGYSDPRLPRLFRPSTRPADPAGRFRGIRLGINMPDNTLYQPFSEVRSDFNVIWMSAAEVSFLKAEAAMRGWSMGGTAQSLYETGIRQSFSQWGVSGADQYLQNADRRPATYQDPVGGNSVGAGSSLLATITIRWEENANAEQKLERIMTQKWIAMYPNGQEAWSEFRRTGYPRLFPVVVNQSGSTVNTSIQVRRLPYPASEYEFNRTNLAQGITFLGGPDNGGTRLWWDRK
ncbi:RagB/SusD family nutrient uptake outer membrane protein [Sphingobacterium spiritivorum]|uniref:RagB/SusD family nutrient uptake outer membrane protein n=1 Tax=Sphingobacterium spiritivorum TaxID=258 RepID=UPI00191B28FE|nr:RagB/SusD family nutrient uptake outer membrane protein [Sphingobacterium spiritivorum]QQT26007.1 SusD/RagB family nutrient-binding outer membrane lipoprotein [Sphingobacterium spiritivorum]